MLKDIEIILDLNSGLEPKCALLLAKVRSLDKNTELTELPSYFHTKL